MRRPSSLWLHSVPLRVCGILLALAVLVVAGYFTTTVIVRTGNRRPWMNTSLSPDQRANLLMAG